MQDLSLKEQTTKPSVGVKAACGLAAIILALVAIFPLGAWAEATVLHHYLQHVMIFLAGTGLGAAAFGDYFKANKTNRNGGKS